MRLSRSLFVVTLAAVCASVGVGVGNAQVPTEPNFPTFKLSEPRVANGTVSVRVGENVTLSCNYEPDMRWGVQLLRWHPNKTGAPPLGMRRFLPLVYDRTVDRQFLAILEQFSELRDRISSSFDKNGVHLHISNFQYEDAGDFGCVAQSYSRASQYANLTITVVDKVLYADIEGNQQQTLELKKDEETQVTFNCSLYHVFGFEGASDVAWFKQCNLFNASGERLAKPQCSETLIPHTLVKIGNITDPNRYGEFWPRGFGRTTVQATVALTAAHYNKSIGCFARKNDDNNTEVSDFVTITQKGVDLHLDPANFDCSPHHVNATAGSTVTFKCTVKEPAYRKFRIFWQVITPRSGGAESTTDCAASTDCRQFNGVFVSDLTSKAENAYVNNVQAMVQVKVHESTTATYKYRVVASYLDNTKRFQSDNFTILLHKPNVDVGAVKGTGDGASHGPCSWLLLTTAYMLVVKLFA